MDEEGRFHDEVRSSWDALAAFWDERIEAGRTWQRHLIYPPVERLLELEPGERVLDVACGNGELARRMADLGGQVLAVDFSEGMLRRARAHGGQVEYRHVDATNEEALLSLGEPGSFDAVVSNMAIMDMQSIEPMVASASLLLRPDGRFVFSTLHPAFNSGDARPTVEFDPEGSGSEVYSVKVSSYGRPSRSKGVAIPGQPVVAMVLPSAALDDPGPILRASIRARRARGAASPSRARAGQEAWNARVRVHPGARRACRSDAALNLRRPRCSS